MIAVLITTPDKDAEKIAHILLQKRLCACVNIIKSVDSLFLWKNKIEAANESLLIVKTKDSLFSRLAKEVKKNHPYDIPEIVSIKIDNFSKSYQNWLNKELSRC